MMSPGCAGCGFDVAAEFAFCPKCGRKVAALCGSCGTSSPPDFAFCPRCGAGLGPAEPASPLAARPIPVASAGPVAHEASRPRPAPEGDAGGNRRPATVLFADLAGFTAIGERLDPEDVRAFQNDLFAALSAAIERYEGFVEKYVGDAVMAVFGAPIAHEDDPERALRAALDMHAQMPAISARWSRRLGQPAALHVGVNTGLVVAGRLAGQDAAFAVTGDTVNTAARLQSKAEGGQTLVSQATYLLTRHAFAFEALGQLTLKGKVEPVPVYRVVGIADAPRPRRGLEAEGLVSPLVGRDAELAQMQATFDRGRRGHAQIVIIGGDAGAGKSRLLAEFLARLDATGQVAGVTVRQAACSSMGEQPYGVIARFFREGYGVTPDDTLAAAREKITNGLRALGVAEDEVAGVAPILGYVLGLEAGDKLAEVEPETAKRQIFLLLRLVFERRLSQGPLLLVVEDLHWADAASVEGLRVMADWLSDRPLVILCTGRPRFDVRALATSRASLTTLRLPDLTEQDGTAILDAFFGPAAAQLPARLREVIVKRAGGNPFYLEEIVRDLIATGVLARARGEWLCTADAAAVDVPTSIQGILLARVDRLPAAARQLLQEAAVLGPSFEPRVLREVASDRAGCEATLELLSEAGLVEEAPLQPDQGAGVERLFRFDQTLVQEVVYQNLLVRRRTELHGRAGEVLERLRGAQPSRLEDLEALGRHFGLSEHRLKGAEYLVGAGDWARGIYANEDALRHYEQALRALGECEGSQAHELRVCERLGDLLGPAGRRAEALAHFEKVRQAADEGGDQVTAARLYRKLGRLHWDGGERERALACLDAGLRLLEGMTDHIELAHLYQEMGRLAFRSGDNQEAVKWAELGLGQAERAANHAAGNAEDAREAAAAMAHALNTLGVALARLDRTEEAVGHIERSVAVAREHGLLNVACRSYANLGVLYAQLDPRQGIEACQTGLDTAKKIGDFGFQSRLYANLAVAYCALTDRCDVNGIQAAQAAIDLDRRLGQVDHLAVPLIVLGQIYQCHGEPDTALAYYREALSLAEESGEPQLLFPCYDGLGTIFLDKGDPAEAERYLVKANEVCDQAGTDRDSLVVLPFLD